MGLVSPSLAGWLIFDTEMTWASFRILGTMLEESEIVLILCGEQIDLQVSTSQCI